MCAKAQAQPRDTPSEQFGLKCPIDAKGIDLCVHSLSWRGASHARRSNGQPRRHGADLCEQVRTCASRSRTSIRLPQPSEHVTHRRTQSLSCSSTRAIGTSVPHPSVQSTLRVGQHSAWTFTRSCKVSAWYPQPKKHAHVATLREIVLVSHFSTPSEWATSRRGGFLSGVHIQTHPSSSRTYVTPEKLSKGASERQQCMYSSI
jgi:hypothetical protein